MPHRAARLTETRERLLTAAETLFPARGFEATSMRDLATALSHRHAAGGERSGGRERVRGHP
jgi:tetracycline repressor-like protein